MISWVYTSHKDPFAIPKNCLNSPLEFRPDPSLMFDGTDTDALLIWLVRPNFSSEGKLADSK